MKETGVTAVLLLSCPDQKGLVASVSDFLYRNDGNIIHADQHTDAEEGIFLQRVEWELAGFRIPREEIREAFQPIAERFGMTWRLHFSDYLPR
ncbi:MAG: ACT domain-containing protein, partial [Dehalococcoidia bacterium]